MAYLPALDDCPSEKCQKSGGNALIYSESGEDLGGGFSPFVSPGEAVAVELQWLHCVYLYHVITGPQEGAEARSVRGRLLAILTGLCREYGHRVERPEPEFYVPVFPGNRISHAAVPWPF